MNRRDVESLIRVHQAELFRYLRYLGARPDAEVEDLVQEAFLVALRGDGPRATDERQQAAWLRGIARNLFLAHCRKERTARTHLTADAMKLAEQVWADEFLGDGDGFDYAAALRKCLDKLPAGKRQFVERRYADGFTREQLAAAFRLTADGVKTALRRIRQQLADCVTATLEAERR